MKYKFKIATVMLAFFIITQIIGLIVVASYKNNFYSKEMKEKLENKTKISKEIYNQTNKSFENKSIIEQNISITREFIPEKVEIKTSIDLISIITSFIVALIIATLFFVILMKIGTIKVMRAWFFLVVLIALFISFSLISYNLFSYKLKFLNKLVSFNELFSLVLALFFAYYKIFKRNIIVHNFTEIFIYPGITVLFLPLINLYIIIFLLILISIYDFIAVFKTKHMQKMAKFMINNVKVFSGFLFPYIDKKDELKLKRMKKISNKVKKKRIKINIAVLGGGDIAFPMLFINLVFLKYGIINALLVILFSTLALSLLLIFGKKDKSYPALPPLTAGCLVGYLLSLLI